MSDLLPRLRTVLQRHGLLRPDALILAAVSGGPDSLCLLHLLWRLHAAGGPQVHVAHFDHGLRPESPAEARYVADTATAWGAPVSVGRGDLAALAGASGDNLMAVARRARYAFLAATARAVGAWAVAVAHQADDQAETVLLHLLRGAGPAGLRGMREMTPWAEWAAGLVEAPLTASPGSPAPGPPLLRPLLGVTRATIEGYCREQRLAPLEDPSNRSERYTRARVRRLIAALAAENPRIVETLGRTAAICTADYDFLQTQLDAAWPMLAVETPRVIILRRSAWERLHPALQGYALRRAAAHLGLVEVSQPQIEAARALAGQPGRCLRLGSGLRLEVEQERLIVAPLAAPLPDNAPQLEVDELPLTLPGRLDLGGGWMCVAQTETPRAPSAWWVALDPQTLDGPLVLRRRRPGDRFRPIGAPGSRLLQDFFVDRKVPRGLRDAWPILATPSAVVWVPGHRADQRFVAAGRSQDTIWIGLITTREALSWVARQGGPQAVEGRMHRDIARVLISTEELQARIAELGAQISTDYAGVSDLLLVGVLKGCAMFMVDLARSIDLPLAIDFIAVASYGASTESSGVVRLLKDLDTDIAGRHVLIVEDIIDSGLTLAYLRGQLLRRNPASLRICTLLNKPKRRIADVPIDYLGFDIPNEFVVGYGLDYAEHYRNLPYIGILKPEIYSA
ncbi:MAG: hypoxanthine phosphoribosyltransferase [Chloroflexaceae bacterium]